MNVLLIKNPNGNNSIIYNDNRFRFNSKYNNTFYWICSKKDSLKCPARVVTHYNGKHMLIKTSDHNHNKLRTCKNNLDILSDNKANTIQVIPQRGGNTTEIKIEKDEENLDNSSTVPKINEEFIKAVENIAQHFIDEWRKKEKFYKSINYKNELKLLKQKTNVNQKIMSKDRPKVKSE